MSATAKEDFIGLIFIVARSFTTRYVRHIAIATADTGLDIASSTTVVASDRNKDFTTILTSIKFNDNSSPLGYILSPFVSARHALVTCLPADETVCGGVSEICSSSSVASILLPQQSKQPLVIRLVVWPKTNLRKIGEALDKAGVMFHPTLFTHVLSVYCYDDDDDDDDVKKNKYSLGVRHRSVVFDVVSRVVSRPIKKSSVTTTGTTTTCTTTGATTRDDETAVCRAQYKLEELQMTSTCFQRALIECRGNAGAALDVGASPGGWTAFLSDNLGDEGHVVACDPGQLSKSVLLHQNVQHLCCKVEDVQNWCESCPQVFRTETTTGGERERGEEEDPLQSGTNEGEGEVSSKVGRNGFTLLTCDMNGMDPRDLMRVMVKLGSEVCCSGATMIVTLKLYAKVSVRQAEKLMQDSVIILEKSNIWKVEERLWLLANRSNERTIVAVRR